MSFRAARENESIHSPQKTVNGKGFIFPPPV